MVDIIDHEPTKLSDWFNRNKLHDILKFIFVSETEGFQSTYNKK